MNRTKKLRFPVLPIILFALGASFSACNSNKNVKEKTDSIAKDTIPTLTDDGAWCWFSDPRAIYYSEDKIVTGWVKKDGSIETASLNIETGEKEFENINPKMEVDDHDNPAFAVLSNGNIITMYAWHSTKKGVISNTTTNGSDVHSFDENVVFKPVSDELLENFPRETYTYANPYILKAEDSKLFSFGRWIGYKPNLIISGDNGKTWDQQYVVVSNEPFDPNNRPYAKYYSDGASKIHMIYTNGHPRNEEFNSVYYCYYENGAFWKADGTKICTLSELPFDVEDGSLVYQASTETGRAWIADVVEKNGAPYILYSRHPEETDHRYHYAWYNSGSQKWEDVELCKAGKWFPQTQEGEVEREPHYMGNMTFNPQNPNDVYLSREVNDIFEIEKYSTNDQGKTWDITPITENSEYDNVRPYVPRYLPESAKTVVLWMENKKYIHYTDYDTRIKYMIEE
ncbi:BNR-4 repeat-containing protein [Maribellus maritimus]|uniref:BNR-4 repeat-containing protein n=1 Tax=Maribellus maritimus TaxID=2870838 RepID=UPI001EEBA41E|nr:BNR-4 repeat-containing protein [Maribellus maritimus]MCG6189062.1 BNR repeat-containing protein [Maribellus maritimus]